MARNLKLHIFPKKSAHEYFHTFFYGHPDGHPKLVSNPDLMALLLKADGPIEEIHPAKGRT